MGKLHDLLIETVVAEAVARGDTELDQDVLVKRMEEIAPKLAQSGAKSYLDSIKERRQGWDKAVSAGASEV